MKDSVASFTPRQRINLVIQYFNKKACEANVFDATLRVTTRNEIARMVEILEEIREVLP